MSRHGRRAAILPAFRAVCTPELDISVEVITLA